MTAPWIVGAIALLAAAAGVQDASLRRARVHDMPAVLYLRAPEAARRVVLSFDALAADLYWVRALQLFGRARIDRSAPRRLDDLYPFLDLATSLDPRFNVAYRFGAIFLSEAPPGGPGRPDQAIALLEKGLRANPTRWEYHQDIGFVHYWWTGDYPKAAAAFSRAAVVPGAPSWLKGLAAVTLTEGGDRHTSRVLFRAILQSAEQEWMRRDAQRRLVQLDALDQIDILTGVVDRARAAGLRAPWSWARLFSEGYLDRVPIDPTGVPFVIDMTTGDVGVSRTSELWPLPREPTPRAAGAERTRER